MRPPASSSLLRYALLSANIILGAFLWLDYFTDYEVAIPYSDIWFPLAVGTVGFTSYLHLAPANQHRRSKLLLKFVTFPSVVGALCSLLIFIPPMCVFSLSALDNSAHETLVQQEVSPNGMRVASIYRGYAGMINADEFEAIRVGPRGLPLIDRELYRDFRPTWCEPSSGGCIQWMDNRTIQILPTGHQIDTHGVGPSAPLWLVTVLLTFVLLFR